MQAGAAHFVCFCVRKPAAFRFCWLSFSSHYFGRRHKSQPFRCFENMTLPPRLALHRRIGQVPSPGRLSISACKACWVRLRRSRSRRRGALVGRFADHKDAAESCGCNSPMGFSQIWSRCKGGVESFWLQFPCLRVSEPFPRAAARRQTLDSLHQVSGSSICARAKL